MQIQVLEHLGSHAEQWDQISAGSSLPSPFLRSWWVDNAAAADPAILVCTDDDGALIGGAAFELDSVGRGALSVQRVRCLGQGTLAPDHLDVIAAPGRRHEVLGAVGRWLLDGDRVIDLDGLSQDCELPFLLDADIMARTTAPYVALEEQDPVSRLPGRLRSTIKRTTKRLARDGFEARRVPPEETARALDALLQLHDSRWDEDSSFSQGWSAFCAAATVGMQRGEVVIHELTDGDNVIASELEMVAAGRASFYQSGRLTDHEYRGSGSALKAAVIRWAKDTGCSELDLLRGAESYKDEWATAQRSVVRIRTGVGPRGRAVAAAADLWTRSKPHLGGVAARLRRP